VYRAWLTAQSLRFRIRALKTRYRDQRIALDFVKRHARPNEILCDVGANKGGFIYWLSYWCKGGKVVAFEPQPDLAADLVDACNAIKLRNVIVEAKAVFSHSGSQDLFVPTQHRPSASLRVVPSAGEAFTKIEVPTVALDDYFCEHDRIAFLKIDVEGAELDVLKGSERILRQWGPLILFECENRHLAHGRVEDAFSYLTNLGYEGSFVRRKTMVPISEFDASVHQRQSGEWFWKSKDYCNNFIFINRGTQRALKM
jgi:FkbM family methyltransferase